MLIIRDTSRDGDDCVAVSIKDTGVGIPLDIQDRVTIKEVGRGTGQGLAIAYSIVVDKHGGLIDLHSVPDKGGNNNDSSSSSRSRMGGELIKLVGEIHRLSSTRYRLTISLSGCAVSCG